MKNNWKETTLGEVAEITQGSSPRPIHEYIRPKGMPWVKIADASASQTRFIESTKEFIKPEGVKNSVVVYPDELIVSNSATPGIPKFMKIQACIHDGWLLFRKMIDIDRWFAYYLMLAERDRLVHSASGSVFNNLKTEIVKNFPILLPLLPEQKAIAAILSSFDDKIELLRQ